MKSREWRKNIKEAKACTKARRNKGAWRDGGTLQTAGSHWGAGQVPEREMGRQSREGLGRKDYGFSVLPLSCSCPFKRQVLELYWNLSGYLSPLLFYSASIEYLLHDRPCSRPLGIYCEPNTVPAFVGFAFYWGKRMVSK